MNDPLAAELRELLVAAETGELTDSQQERLNELICTSDAAADSVVQHLETEALLQWHHGAVDVVSVPEVVNSTASPRARRTLVFGSVASVAVVLIAVGLLFGPGRPRPAPETNAENQAHSDETDSVKSIGDAGAVWVVQATDAADFEELSPTRYRLHRGEISVTSNDGTTSSPLTIETPQGTVRAQSGSFVVGTHVLQDTGSNMNRLTRILVLAGAATLMNAQGEVTGEENSLLSVSSQDDVPRRLVVRSNSEFAFDLYRELASRQPGENVFFSPYSIASALAMAAEGARGLTADEMGRVLRYPEAARRVGDDAQLIPWRTSLLNTGFAELNARLTARDTQRERELNQQIATLQAKLLVANAALSLKRNPTRDDYRTARDLADQINELVGRTNRCELTVANALWGEQSYSFRPEYTDTIARFFGTGAVFPVDFKNDAAAAGRAINRWVSQQTRSRIPQIVDAERISPDTKLMLTNAVYFKGDWAEPFEERRTRVREFTRADGSTLRAPMMTDRYRMRYAAFQSDGTWFDTPREVPVGNSRTNEVQTYPGDDGFQMIELPYHGEKIVMVLLAPQTPAGLAAVEEKLDAGSFEKWLARMAERTVRVYVPRFRMETSYTLGGSAGSPLEDLGMRRAFSDLQADFSGMSEESRLKISQVAHRAFVEVNEKGTEAAAVTVVAMKDAAAAPRKMVPFTPVFNANRPFLFAIRDRETGTVLFLGRVHVPKEK